MAMATYTARGRFKRLLKGIRDFRLTRKPALPKPEKDARNWSQTDKGTGSFRN